MRRIGHFWTAEEDARLKQLCDAGLSAALIAEDLGEGFTRNSIIGRIFRLGLKKGETTSSKPRKDGRVKGIKKRKLRPRIPKQDIKWTAPANGPRLVEMRCADVESRDLSIFDLREGDCRWPHGGYDDAIVFCGNPIFRGSYCAAHARLNIGHGTGSERNAHYVSARHLEDAA